MENSSLFLSSLGDFLS